MNESPREDCYDLIVIGAGISGLAITRAAARQGLKTLLLERAALGAATSSNSLRIIHGGFRYLQTLNLPRVVFSLKEQARVLREFPDLIQELPCYLPLQRFGLKSGLSLHCASVLYRTLGKAVGVSTPPAVVLHGKSAIGKLSLLAGHVPDGAFMWTDFQLLSPELLHQRLAIQSAEAGAIISVNSPVSKLERRRSGFNVCFSAKGNQQQVYGSTIVSAAGPWANALSLTDESTPHPGIAWCRAFNLVFRGNQFGAFGLALSARDGRQYFVVGRGDETVVGTQYLPFQGDPAASQLDDKEILEFFSQIEGRVPGLARENYLRTELGVLPIHSAGAIPERSLIGAARMVHRNGYISLLSTKYTTFLGQADQVVAMVKNHLIPG